MNLYEILCLLFFCLFNGCESKYAFVSEVDGNLQVSVTDYYADVPDVHIAKATYSNEINTTGWAFLEIHTSVNASDEQQVYSAGYLEGYLTRDLVWMHWQNMIKGYCYNKTDVCGLIEEFVDANEEYIAEMVKTHPNDVYWYQMKLYYIQIEGLAVGYNKATSNQYEWLTLRDIIWLNMLGDLDELAFALSLPASNDDILFPDHCTGLVKLLPDLSNLYTSHVTWNSYQSMLRIQKMYVLHIRESPGSNSLIAGHKMSFTSYPGLVQSTDDFYIMSGGLVAAETTIGNSNRTLFQHVHPRGQILEYARGMVASRVARSGAEWVRVFRRHNSGTYNNQWYIVDYKKFKARTASGPGRVEPGLLWLLEQLPGYIEAADITSDLLNVGYHPSYNIAYFPSVFSLGGGDLRVRMYGDWFLYEQNPRAKIFKQRQGGVQNLRDMYSLLRYNDYLHDPASRCPACRPPYSACNALSARNDLNPSNGTYPFRALGHRSHGATDVKVTSASLHHTMQFLSQSSPTHNISRGIPPFRWSEFDMGAELPHVGHPDLWMFHPLVHSWEWG